MTDFINIGASANDGTGDPLRTAFEKINTLVSRIIDVTTGASPTSITLSDYKNWVTLAVRVTSGGTAGTEVLNFIGPDDGDETDTLAGRTLNVVFVAQTDPSDIVHITQNSGGTISCIDSLGNAIGSFSVAAFNEVGNNITFGFNGDVIQQYRWNCLYGNWDSPTTIAGRREPLPSGAVDGQILVASGSQATWSSSLPVIPIFNGGSVAVLNSNYPAADHSRAMAVVFDADTPVVGSPVVGSGSSECLVISNGTDYIVMFIFP